MRAARSASWMQCHYAAHRAIDVKALDCDFLVCSPYKFYGPHTGVLYAKASVMAALDVAKLEPAPNDIPERMETGTQNHEGIVGAGAAVDFLASLALGGSRREKVTRALGELHEQGEALVAQLWDGLSAIPGVRCYGPPPGTPRDADDLVLDRGMAAVNVAEALAEQGIFVSHGNFYATNRPCAPRHRSGRARACRMRVLHDASRGPASSCRRSPAFGVRVPASSSAS
jgi:selenocysteine lyase/cysteine desulfurase